MTDFDWLRASEKSRITDPMQNDYFKWQMVVCRDQDTRAIGFQNQLLWDLPLERKLYLHDVIKNTTLVVGRKTFESLPTSFIEKNDMVVVTRDEFFINKRDQFVDGYGNNVEEVKAACDRIGKKVSVIGGSEIYRMFWDKIDRLHLSEVVNPDALLDPVDSFFPVTTSDIHEKNGGGSCAGLCYMAYRPIYDKGVTVNHGRWDFLKLKAGLV